MTEDYDVSVWSLVKEKCGYSHEGVEPTARLVNSFTDEVGGELSLEYFFVFKRIVVLSERH